MFDPNRYSAARMTPGLMKSPYWLGHIPFAFELVTRLRPRRIVELGTYSGSSLAAFCQAVEAVGLDCQCVGIDAWKGDVHLGSFDESVFREVSQYMSARHPRTARLIRSRFDAAVKDFADKSIDILHIDGTHTYEAVSNDYHTWLSKVSDRGVILFHDVNVTYENCGESARHFGVRRLFDEIKDRYPHLEFSHSFGLGVLVAGNQIPPDLETLLRDSGDEAFPRYFERLGNRVIRSFELSGGIVPFVARKAVNAVRRLVRSRAGGAG